MLTETLVFWLVLCVGVAILAYISRSLPIACVSSFGFIIAGMQYYTEDPDIFVLGMLWAIALFLPLAISKKDIRI